MPRLLRHAAPQAACCRLIFTMAAIQHVAAASHAFTPAAVYAAMPLLLLPWPPTRRDAAAVIMRCRGMRRRPGAFIFFHFAAFIHFGGAMLPSPCLPFSHFISPLRHYSFRFLRFIISFSFIIFSLSFDD